MSSMFFGGNFRFALELRRKGCTNIEQGPVMVASDTTRYTFHGLVPGQAYTMKLTVVTSEQACGEPKEADGTVGKELWGWGYYSY